MTNMITVMGIISTLFAAVNNSLEAIKKYQELVDKAHDEGRDITDDELEELKLESQKLTQQVLGRLH